MAQNQENEADFKGSKTTDEENCFKQRENTADEVVLTFDDGQTMYVSASFLSYASPVFKAMFQHDFKEKETREVKLTGKDYDDFHEFLLCLHPGVQRPVDRKNVLQIVSIADEYQVSPTVTKCKQVMSDWINSEINSAASGSNNSANYPRARSCLNILKKANECCFTEITDLAVKTIARFGHKLFSGTATNSPPSTISTGLLGRPATTTSAPPSTRSAIAFGASVATTGSTGFRFGTPTTQSSISSTGSTIFFGSKPVAVTASTGFSLGSTTTPSFGTGFDFGNQKNTWNQDDSEAKLLKPGTQLDDPKADCKVMFDSLPECLKTSLLLARLDLCDDGNMR